MADYSTLTGNDLEVVDEHITQIRAWAAAFDVLLENGEKLQISWNATGGPAELLAGNTDELPNKSGLRGAQDVPDATFDSILTAISNILSTYNTTGTRANIAILAGPTRSS